MEIDSYALEYDFEISMDSCNLEIDTNAVDNVPEVIAGDPFLIPAVVHAYGDCLPHCGSVYAFQNANHPLEIRARIIIELAIHKALYLDANHLRKGVTTTDKQASLLPTTYTMMSDIYFPGTKMTRAVIEEVFAQELQSIATRLVYMGIWQLFGLASVLKRKLRSVYPMKGNPLIRIDLNIILHPRIETNTSPVATIMWTTTRADMQNINWVSNHFVPLVPLKSTLTHIQANLTDKTDSIQ